MDSRRWRKEAGLLGNAQRIIVEELRKIPEFQQIIAKLANDFPDMSSLEHFEYPPDLMVLNKHIDPNDKAAVDRMVRYTSRIVELAKKYNLWSSGGFNDGRGWMIPMLHFEVRRLVTGHEEPIAHWYMEFQIDELNIPISGTTRKTDIIRQVDKEWERLKRKHPELQGRERYPEKFDQHVRWLCQRLFYGKTGATIETEKDISLDYIDFTIRTTAKFLGIKLPRGKIPKYKKR